MRPRTSSSIPTISAGVLSLTTRKTTSLISSARRSVSARYRSGLAPGLAGPQQRSARSCVQRLPVFSSRRSGPSQRMLLTGRFIRFETLESLLEPHPWVTDEQGRLVGHMLTVDGAALDNAIDGDLLEAFSVPDALSRPWSDVDTRVSWGDLYAASLRALADRAEGATRAAEHAWGLRRTLDTLKR